MKWRWGNGLHIHVTRRSRHKSFTQVHISTIHLHLHYSLFIDNYFALKHKHPPFNEGGQTRLTPRRSKCRPVFVTSGEFPSAGNKMAVNLSLEVYAWGHRWTLGIIITNLHTTMNKMALQIEINATTFIVQSRKTGANVLIMWRVFVCVCAQNEDGGGNKLLAINSELQPLDGWVVWRSDTWG